MKFISKSVIMGAAAFIMAAASAEAAPTIIRITGSTAYRATAHKAILNVLGSVNGTNLTGSARAGTFAYNTSGNLGGSSQAWFSGTLATGEQVTFETFWNGSVAGIQAVGQISPQITVNFLADTQGTATAAGAVVSSGTNAQHPDACFVDNDQSVTPFTNTAAGSTTSLTLVGAGGYPNGNVGVVVFKWLANKSAPISGITSQLAQNLYAVGNAPLYQFTGGDPTVDTATVFAIGRNPDSGTRIGAHAEAGIGINTTVFNQLPTIVTGAYTGFANYTAGTVNGISFLAGMNGYSSGSASTGLVSALIATGSSSVGYAVGYAGASDCDASITAGNVVELSYNGVTLGVSADYNTNKKLTSGLYTFWGYERILYPSTIGTVAKAGVDALATQIHDVDAVVLLSNMAVGRVVDGGVVQ